MPASVCHAAVYDSYQRIYIEILFWPLRKYIKIKSRQFSFLWKRNELANNVEINHPFLFIYSWELFSLQFRRGIFVPPLAEWHTHKPSPVPEFCLRSSLPVISVFPSVCLWSISHPFSGSRLRHQCLDQIIWKPH